MLSPPKNQKNKNSSFFNPNSNIISPQKNSVISTTLSVNNTKFMIPESSKKNITPIIDFIKQKKNFFIHNAYDKNGTKNFLAERDVAMMEIQLNEEILEDNIKRNINKINIKSPFEEIKNELDIKEKNNKIDKRTKTISPNNRKKNKDKENNLMKNKKSKYKIIKKNENKIKNENNNNDNNICIIDEINEDSKGNEFIYKFIIDNVDESDDNFNKKLEKVIQRVETEKMQKKKDKKEKIFKSNTNKLRYSECRPKNDYIKSREKKGSIFNFSEKAKFLMTNADIEESSISSNYNNDNHEIKNEKRNSVQNKEDKILFDDEEINSINNKKKDSLISILDELV